MSEKMVAVRQALAAFFDRAAEVVTRDAKMLYNFAADNMLVVAIIIAAIGVILLRPRHTPR